ncbi:uncharacterized protein LOC111392801 [Olea europaea var. sylvestris]|uniref:uncharacterized protein LOC111392801 n=1 Tax=Olea europaea var. sylvestris TaxID=158386 RepID=UPI000C1D60E3|nr:uncharacterized protein LOC111392801 [Olea europaea var. sylvestris]
MSLEDMVKSLTSSTIQFQQETKTSIKNLETQVCKVQKEILETFRKIQVNIALLDAIYQVPRYAKFLKDLCTNKHRLKGNEVESVGKNVSTVLQKKLSPKCKDPGSFSIPCIIGNTRFEKAMLDLRASINLMLYSIYASLNLGSLKETDIIIQVADRSNAFPKGVLDDVLVQVNQLIFLADFYVLDMQDKPISLSPPLLLGRPFMIAACTKIDVHDSTLTMEFDGEIIRFNIFEAMRYPSDDHACFSIDIIDSLVHKVFELSNKYALNTTLIKSIDVSNLIGLSKNLQVFKDFIETVASLESLPSIPPRYDLSCITLPISKEKLLLSVMQAPTLKLKPLPDHLKYVYLGEEETLPVIIAKNLTTLQEDRLIRVLKEHKIAIG